MEQKNRRDTMTRREYMRLYKKKGVFAETMEMFFKNKLAILGLILFLIIVLVAVFADVIVPYKSVITINPIERLQTPNSTHWLGTDELGRDIFGRIVHGARISLRIGVIAIALSLIGGGILGSIAGYFGGTLDNIIMRFMDVFICLPSILMAIAIVATFGSSESILIIAIAISQVPPCARIVRSAILSVRGQEYVEAARALGDSVPSIILGDVLLNCMGPIIVHITLSIATSITTVASLSFIGLGISAPAPEWGCMLASARSYMRDYPHLVMAPGFAIFFTVFSFNLLGDGLRDALDPRLRQ